MSVRRVRVAVDRLAFKCAHEILMETPVRIGALLSRAKTVSHAQMGSARPANAKTNVAMGRRGVPEMAFKPAVNSM